MHPLWDSPANHFTAHRLPFARRVPLQRPLEMKLMNNEAFHNHSVRLELPYLLSLLYRITLKAWIYYIASDWPEYP